MYDQDQSGQVSEPESREALLPQLFTQIDVDQDQHLTLTELQVSMDRVADSIPNLAIPEMNSVGAMELPVAVVAGVCDGQSLCHSHSDVDLTARACVSESPVLGCPLESSLIKPLPALVVGWGCFILIRHGGTA